MLDLNGFKFGASTPAPARRPGIYANNRQNITIEERDDPWIL